MRTIKFRAKRSDNHPVYWAYGYFVKTPITAEFNDCDGAFFDSGKSGRYCIVTDSGVAHEIDITTLGEFTGLYDKNGKEIYEGDIIKQGFEDTPIGQVIFSDGEFGINYPKRNKGYGFCSIPHFGGGTNEVIGDTHTNPELTNQVFGRTE